MKRCARCKQEKPESEFWRRAQAKSGKHYWCKACCSEVKREYATKYADRLSRARQKQHQARRQKAIEIYGGHCVCCGETELGFLSIDHVDGGGTAHRRRVGAGSNFYYWLQRQGYPKDPPLQVLCYNCNLATAFQGACPHKLRE